MNSPVSPPELPEPRRILVVGDLHLNWEWLFKLPRIALDHDCQAIVQLGDLDFMPRRAVGARYLRELELQLEDAWLSLYFLEGNHDDLTSLWGAERRMRGPFVEISRHVLYMPRACRFTWRGVRFLAVGGAASIDREWRRRAEQQPRTLWWPEETLSERDVRVASIGGGTDILFSHDAPAGVEIRGVDRWFPEAVENRARLARIVDATRPRLLLHGHYHERFTSVYTHQLLSLHVPTIGLAAAGEDDDDSWLVLDLTKPGFGLAEAGGDDDGDAAEDGA